MLDPQLLSTSAQTIWAKTRGWQFPESPEWLSLGQHLADTAGVIQRLWVEFLSPAARAVISSSFDTEDEALTACCFLAGVHDIGKASPAFASQRRDLATRGHTLGLTIDALVFDYARGERPRHDTIGYLAVRDWLQSQGIGLSVAKQFGMIVGAHHGLPPEQETVARAIQDQRGVGTGKWLEARNEIMTWASQGTGFDAILGRLPKLSPAGQLSMSGLVIMADWIASNNFHFPLVQGQDTATRVADGWAALNLAESWAAGESPEDPADFMAQRFDLPADAKPRPIQTAAVRHARQMRAPGLMVIEASMGEGKTEAALLAAEVMAQRFGLGGVFVGLPTQATSNAMFSRVLSWMERLGGTGDPAVFLAHAKRELNDDYEGLRAETWGTTSTDEPERSRATRSRAVINAWLSGKKRGMLAPFVIGTIDQVLMSALKSKHVVLRHLSFAGKVVILDEVHAADAYMSVFLEGALKWLGASKVPVILLSATLPAAQRTRLIDAYGKGAGVAATASDEVGYPLISTLVPSDGLHQEVVPQGRPSVPVRLRALKPGENSLLELLRLKISDGGRVAVVRNTVKRAQETARILVEAFPGIPVTLSHSRFIASDRARLEQGLITRFGPNAANQRHSEIVVATQTIEQSLDVDFDLMISDLAPVDLLLQRAGRLHRHAARNPHRPEPLQAAELWIDGVDWSSIPQEPHPSYGPVYERFLLLRTLLALKLAPGSELELNLPEDIPGLISQVYDEGGVHVPQDWQFPLAESRVAADRRQAEREALAKSVRLREPERLKDLTGLASAGASNPDEPGGHRVAAAVRDGADSIEVLVIQRGPEGLRLPSWIPGGGEALPEYEPPNQDQARSIRFCSLPISGFIANSAGMSLDQLIEELEKRLPAWSGSLELDGELILILDQQGQAEFGGAVFEYDQRWGLNVRKQHA